SRSSTADHHPQRVDLWRATSSGGLRQNRIATPTWADEVFGTGNVDQDEGARVSAEGGGCGLVAGSSTTPPGGNRAGPDDQAPQPPPHAAGTKCPPTAGRLKLAGTTPAQPGDSFAPQRNHGPRGSAS